MTLNNIRVSFSATCAATIRHSRYPMEIPCRALIDDEQVRLWRTVLQNLEGRFATGQGVGHRRSQGRHRVRSRRHRFMNGEGRLRRTTTAASDYLVAPVLP